LAAFSVLGNYRTWVSASYTASPTVLATVRTVVRCHSDGDILAGSKAAANARVAHHIHQIKKCPAQEHNTPRHSIRGNLGRTPQYFRGQITHVLRQPDDMPTPTLTNLPSSTESSSGDCTIHMASFIDDLGTNKCFDTMLKHPPSPMYHSAPPHAPANPALVFDSETYCLMGDVPPMASEFGQHVFAE
jgi:hypothetical protein